MVRDGRKDYKAQTFKMESALVERLDEYSRTTGVAKTFAVERAVEAYLDAVAPSGADRKGERAHEGE